MPFLALIPGLLQAVWSSKPLRYAALAVLLLGAAFAFVAHAKHQAAAAARAAAIAEMQVATEAESRRRQQVIERAQAVAQEAAARLAITEKTNATLLSRIALLSRSNDNRPCLDRAAAQRLRDIDQSRSPAGH